jgi:low temperature requirement protein LtrA
MNESRHPKQMSGRDVNEANRVSSPLELFFDLIFAISLAVVSQQMSLLLAHGEFFAALLSFGISILAVCWAWMNYSWFASAYDTDDVTFRVAAMVHMVGVIVFTLGLPRLFQSIEVGLRLDNSVMVLGYVIMRLVMIFLWIRAARFDRTRRRALLANAAVVFIAQVLWVILIFWAPPLREALIFLAVFGCIEFVGPTAFYWRWGVPPWHAYHIAERYSSLTMIALGEGIYGAVAMTNAMVELHGWSLEPILIATACVGLAFGCWWIYFLNPFGALLKKRRERAYSWGYFHILIFASIVAMGAGLQIAGKYLGGNSKLSSAETLAVTAGSVAVYISSVFIINYLSSLKWERSYFILWGASLAVLTLSYVLAKAGLPLPACLGILTTAPLIVVIGTK